MLQLGPGEPKWVLRGGSTFRGGAFACEWIETTMQIGNTLSGRARAGRRDEGLRSA